LRAGRGGGERDQQQGEGGYGEDAAVHATFLPTGSVHQLPWGGSLAGATAAEAARSTAVYPVIFLDAIVCKVRDNGSVRNKAAHLAVGIDGDGRKEVSVRSNLRVSSAA
jgi:hypothetical protein